jgi:UDP:flavonoid glycosyltransferase YjiC (YdhE family)
MIINSLRDVSEARGSLRIAIAMVDSVGHLNPQIALASKLMQRGHFCRFYLPTEQVKETISKLPYSNMNFSDVEFNDAGTRNNKDSTFREEESYAQQDPSDQHVNDFVLTMMKKSFDGMPKFLADIKAYEPDLIVYDPFLLNPAIAAYMLNVPCCSTITFPGFNYYSMFYGRHTEHEKKLAVDEYKQSKTLSKYRNLFLEKYSFDIFSNFIPTNNYLPRGLNLCTGIKDFDQKMPEVVKPVYGDMDEDCLYVGPMLLTQEQGRVSAPSVIPESEKQWLDEAFPYDALRECKKQGKKIVYASFGTVATGVFWDHEVIPSKMFGALTSGKEFCRTLWGRIFEAFGGKENYVVVLATVTNDPEALEGFEIPSNFIVRRKCPQLEVLKVADAFITHGGANSMMESINSHVPMLVLPYFADQYSNAKTVSREHMGLHFDDPLSSCTTKFMASDVETLLMLRDRFVRNCHRLQKILDKAGGADRASRAIEDYVANFKGHQLTHANSKSWDVDYIEFLLQRCNTSTYRENECGSSFENMLPSFEV